VCSALRFWQAIFYINVPVGLISAGIVLFTMPQTQDRQARPFDIVGVCSMASVEGTWRSAIPL
jgi:hypothetical protein